MTVIFKDKNNLQPGQDLNIDGLTPFITGAETREVRERRTTRAALGALAFAAVVVTTGAGAFLSTANSPSQDIGNQLGTTISAPNQGAPNPVDQQMGGDPIPASNQQNTSVGGDPGLTPP